MELLAWPSGWRRGARGGMLDRWVIGAIVLLVCVCMLSSYVALKVWLPDHRERARIRAERVEHMLRDVGDAEMAEVA